MFMKTNSSPHLVLLIVTAGPFCGTLYYVVSSIMPSSEPQHSNPKVEVEEEEPTTKAMPGYLGGAYNEYV